MLHAVVECLRARGKELVPRIEVRAIQKAIDGKLLYEEPRKAVPLSHEEAKKLLTCQDPSLALPLSLMLPSGARYADVAKIRKTDLRLCKKATVVWRVRELKNVKVRRHQCFLTLRVPTLLWPILINRWKKANDTERIIQTGYKTLLTSLRRFLGNDKLTTYSIRRYVLNAMAKRSRTIDELAEVTRHRSLQQLRWYLDDPLPNEQALHAHLTGWHI
jgi:hypothetical protein